MKPHNHHRPFLAFIVVALVAAGLLTGAGRAQAVMIEAPTRTVERIEVTYVEDVPTKTSPTRAYFELNDGSTYRFRNYRHCYNGSTLPHRVCKTVFWYAR